MNGVYANDWIYGYFEVSMKFQPVTGSWPALWMQPVIENGASTGTDNITYGELDLFEWQDENPTTFYGTLHVWKNNSDIGNSDSNNAWPVPSGTNLANYNTYGVLWTPTEISWYFNNALLGSFSTTAAPFNTVFAGQQPYYLMLGQQIGLQLEPGDLLGGR